MEHFRSLSLSNLQRSPWTLVASICGAVTTGAILYLASIGKGNRRALLFRLLFRGTTRFMRIFGERGTIAGSHSLESKVMALMMKQDQIDFTQLTLLRQRLDEMSFIIPIPSNFGTEKVKIKCDGDDIDALWLTPPSIPSDSPVILYFHGGGYVSGSIKSHAGFVSEICRVTKSRALVVDYSLGPEKPLPAAVFDAVASYKYLLQKEISPKKIFLAGDSAGGGLSCLTLLALRDQGVDLPAGAMLLSPWTDVSTTTHSHVRNRKTDCMIAEINFPGKHISINAIGPHTSMELRKDPRYSPLFANTLKGLPPLLIQVGAFEVLEDDSLLFAEKAEKDGVKVKLERFEGQQHVFQLLFEFIPEARQAIANMEVFINSNKI